jgi:hypothetical protein
MNLANVSSAVASPITAGQEPVQRVRVGLSPSSPLVTENFSGTVQVGGSDSHPFTVTSSGAQITLDLTSVGPPATISMGLGIGGWDGTTCTPLSGGYGTVQASPTPQLGGNISAGIYCAIVSTGEPEPRHLHRRQPSLATRSTHKRTPSLFQSLNSELRSELAGELLLPRSPSLPFKTAARRTRH